MAPIVVIMAVSMDYLIKNFMNTQIALAQKASKLAKRPNVPVVQTKQYVLPPPKDRIQI